MNINYVKNIIIGIILFNWVKCKICINEIINKTNENELNNQTSNQNSILIYLFHIINIRKKI